MVKNAMIIGLCSILALEALFPDVSLADFAYLPKLVSHFQEHKRQSPDLTFGEFLSIHNEETNHFASTPADHKNLPFSKRQHHRAFAQIAHDLTHINTESIYIGVIEVQYTSGRALFPIRVASQIWQPPRA